MILSSWRSRFRPRGSVLRRCLSYSSCEIRCFSALRRGSASCSFLIRAFSLIAPKEKTAELSGILMTSVTFVDSSLSCSSGARRLLSSFRAKISCSDSSSSSGRKKSCSSSATSDDCRLTSIGDVRMSFRSLSCTFSFGVSKVLRENLLLCFGSLLRA